MKKKAVILSLVLGLTLVFGAFQTAFAGVSGFETVPTLENEVDAETVVLKVFNETKAGKYGLVSTSDVKSVVDKNDGSVVILDTMPPAASYNAYHVPGAINYVTPLGKDVETEFTAECKAGLLKAVDAAADTKRVTKYYNKKTKKWQTKRIKGAKTKKVIKSNKPIIIYCGFVKCDRSHVAAQYLVSQGYKNVYRYTGGISAWIDAGYETEAVQAQ